MQENSIAATMQNNTADESDSGHRVICIRAQDSHYAIGLEYVECVLPLMELQPVPGGAYYLAGLMDFRGKGLAVVDLGLWLGLNHAQPYDLDTPVIVCGNGEAHMAFIVDEIVRIEAVKPEAVHMQGLFKAGAAPFEASLKLNSGIALLLDMPRILNVNFTAVNASVPARAFF